MKTQILTLTLILSILFSNSFADTVTEPIRAFTEPTDDVTYLRQGNVRPTAAFTVSPTHGSAPLTVLLDARNSFDADGTIVEYNWSTSDNQTASNRRVNMTFPNVGKYTIDLVVIDNMGTPSTNTAQRTVTVIASNQPPIPKFTTTPLTGSAPLTVDLDASNSTDPDGRIDEYKWETSDRQKAYGKKVNMTFPNVGTYDINLVVVDDKGTPSTKAAQQTVTVTSKKAPIAHISVSPISGEAPLTVSLNGRGSGTSHGRITEYMWTATDGQRAAGANTQMTFNSAGNYTITLTVTNSDGLTASTKQTVTVTEKPNQPPIAKFDLSPSVGTVPLTVNLNATQSSDPDGRIVETEWTTSDGQTAFGNVVNLKFATAGEYKITLTVKDEKEATDSLTQTVTVERKCAREQCEVNEPCVCFVIEKNRLATEDNFFKVQEKLTIKLDIRVDQGNRWDRVDLYVAFQFPHSELFFLNEMGTMIPTDVPYRTNLEQATTQDVLLDIEVPPCYGGLYGLYAAFVPVGGDPMEAYYADSFVSNLAHKTVELDNLCYE